MQTTRIGAAILATLIAGVASAQNKDGANRPSIGPVPVTTTASTTDSSVKAPKSPNSVSLYRQYDINHLRPADQRGVNMFEAPKEDQVPFTGFALSFGGAFTQEFQGLQHENNATPVVTNGVNANQLIAIGHGFNNAVANLNVNEIGRAHV